MRKYGIFMDAWVWDESLRYTTAKCVPRQITSCTFTNKLYLGIVHMNLKLFCSTGNV